MKNGPLRGEKEFPILEFDPSPEAMIEPTTVISPAGLPRRCVICFFREAIEQIRRDGRLEPVYSLHTETIDLPVYRTTVDGVSICVTPAYAGAPGAAWDDRDWNKQESVRKNLLELAMGICAAT